jgi:hypothetical protein
MSDRDRGRQPEEKPGRDIHEGEFRKNDVGDNRPTDRQRPDPRDGYDD